MKIVIQQKDETKKDENKTKKDENEMKKDENETKKRRKEKKIKIVSNEDEETINKKQKQQK